MPWCPKCKSEYREGFTHCSDCDTELAEANPQDQEDLLGEDVEWVFLRNFSESETYVIATFLEEEGIPVLKQRKEAGGYLKVSAGMSIFGVDLYVPSEYLNRAKELLDEQAKAEVVEGLEKEAIEDSTYGKERKKKRWIILLPFFIPILGWVIVELIGRLA